MSGRQKDAICTSGGGAAESKREGLTAAILLAERLAACPDTRKACRYPRPRAEAPAPVRTENAPPASGARSSGTGSLYIHADPPAACPQKAGDVCGGM